MNWPGLSRTYFLLVALSLCSLARAQQPPEFRAFWVDAFAGDFTNAARVTSLVDNIRAAKANAVIPEVRKRGDAYYNSLFEPVASDVAPGYDPLADMIAKAHDTSNGKQRIEVHGWIVSYKIWGSQVTPPAAANHPYNLHPEWLTQDTTGATWDGTSYTFDPSHPDVQRHTFNVCMDIISRYDVDGFNFDYIRYTDNTWGYHPVAVARFNARYGRTGTPAPSDPDWRQFRRDQVTALVRKVYLHAIALKPHIKISADTITWGNTGITSDAQWYSSSEAWNTVLQDWRGWMQEGILDLNIPMNYYRHHNNTSPNHALAYTNWMNFAKDHKYDRHVAIGPGIYLNYTSNAIIQMRATRALSPLGNSAEGVVGYVYKQPDLSFTPFSTFKNFLTNSPNAHDPISPAIFQERVPVPVMPWKAAPTKGHLKGFVFGGSPTNSLDGAIVTLSGPSNRVQTNDATGFYGFVDLLPGNYTVSARHTNYLSATASVTIVTGIVETLDFSLVPPNAPLAPNVWPGATDAIVTWNTAAPSDAQVSYGLTPVADGTWKTSWRDPELQTNHAVLVAGLRRSTNYFYQVHSRAGTNVLTSTVRTFVTAGDIIIDNPNATLVGTWTAGTSSPDKYGANYVFATAGSGATATFTPAIETPGLYDVSVWYPQGGNRPTNAPWTLVFEGGTNNGVVNQTNNGGGWRLVAANLPLARGTNAFFQWRTIGAEAGKVVLADAVRFTYATNQEPPAPGTVPRWWRDFFFGGAVDPSLDPDGDGLTTAGEYLAGTDPMRPSSKLRFWIADGASNRLGLAFSPFHLGRSNALQHASTLGTNEWSNAGISPEAGTNGSSGLFTVTNASAPQKFYRLRVEALP
jgi:uncharacterized lipoprotein YddW (UPF0748 family)